MTTDLIRWQDNGAPDFLGGFAGSNGACLFDMHAPLTPARWEMTRDHAPSAARSRRGR